jgi:ATP-dependent Clp protease ATP-binding subunit ClpA
LSLREKIPLEQIQSLCERFKYGIVESDWDKMDRYHLEQASEKIHARIKGQEGAIIRLMEIIKRAKMGLEAGSTQKSQRPRGVLFFAGPTGVGKTEMAKGLAELLFGQEERLIRFDMSEYASSHADQKLLGAPPGYVGYEEGGKLTNAIQQQPFSVLLFDEIEKAHSSIFDKFLQILDDGRLTDGKGETVYFSECIIIFTSNLGTYSLNNDKSRTALITPEQPYHTVKKIILEAIRQHFNQTLGRPEILNRFGENFVIFDFIRPPVDELIVERLLSQLLISLKEQQGIQLKISDDVRQSLYRLSKKYLEHGGRGVRNMIDAALINPLATALFEHNYDDQTRARSIIHIQQLIDKGEMEIPRFILELTIESIALK